MKFYFTLIFWMLLVSSVNAATYWVMPAGSGNDGAQHCVDSATAPAAASTSRTIAQGIGCMAGGDTLNIRTGIYLEDVGGPNGAGPHPPSGTGFLACPTNMGSIASWKACQVGQPSTVQAYQNEVVTIRTLTIYSVVRQYIVYKNLKVGAPGMSAPTNRMTLGGQVGGVWPSFIKLDNIDAGYAVYGYGGGQIMYISAVASNIWITGSKLHDSGCDTSVGPPPFSNYPLYQTGHDILIEYTEFYNGRSYGLHQTNTCSVYGFTSAGGYPDPTYCPNLEPSPDNNVYRYNYFHDLAQYTAPGGKLGDGFIGTGAPSGVCGYRPSFAVAVLTGNDNQFYGNLVINSENGANIGSNVANENVPGEGVRRHGKGNLTFNNTFYGMTSAQCHQDGTDQCYGPLSLSIENNDFSNIAKNNILYNNWTNTLGVSGNGGWTQSFNFTQDPSFINPSTTSPTNCTGGNCPDFHLQSGSTAIDFGTPTISGSVSIPGCGTPPGCYFGSAPDAGAYETGSGGAGLTVAITSPTINATYVTTTTPVTLSGTSTNATGISWANDQGGGAPCTGTANWTCSAITLAADKVNAITIIATNGANSATTVLRVAYSFPALVGSWAFDENGGTTALDRSGKGNNGTFGAGVAYTTATVKYGTSALSFSGGSVTIPDAASLRLIGGWTITSQVYPFASHNDYRAILVKNYDYYLYAQSIACSGNGPLAGKNTGDICAPAPLSINAWSCVVSTYDGTNLKLYINKQPVQTVAATGLLGAGTGTLQIGNSQFAEPFDGALDNIRLYNYDIGATAANTDCDTGIVPAGVANFRISGATGLKLKGATALEIGH